MIINDNKQHYSSLFRMTLNTIHQPVLKLNCTNKETRLLKDIQEITDFDNNRNLILEVYKDLAQYPLLQEKTEEKARRVHYRIGLLQAYINCNKYLIAKAIAIEETKKDMEYIHLFIQISKAYKAERKFIDAVEMFNYHLKKRIDNKSLIMEKNIEYYFASGLAKYIVEDHKGSIEDYTKILELSPKNIKAYGCRAVSKERLGDLKGAIEDFTKVIDIEPKDKIIFYGRAIVKDKMGDYKGAIEDNNKAIEIDPNFAFAYSNIGAIKAQLKDYKGAIEYFTKAIDKAPNSAFLYNNRVAAKQEIGDLKGAIEDLKQIIEVEPKSVFAYDAPHYIKDMEYQLKEKEEKVN